MDQEMRLDAVPGEKTSAVLATPEGGGDHVVLLCHGFMSNRESSTNRRMTRQLLTQGIATLRFDFFGHGRSDGPFQQLTLTRCLNQAEGMLEWIKRNRYRRIGLVGSSFGGLVAVHLAAKHPELDAVGLKCPVSNYPPIWRAQLGEGGMKNWKESGILSFATPEGKARLEYAFYEDIVTYDSYRAAQEIQAPTLIVHGDADEYVPFDQSLRLFDTLRTERDFEAIPGADHAFSKPADFEKMIDRLSAWLSERRGPPAP